MAVKKISIKDIEGVRIGNAQDEAAATGCTVFLCEQGAPAGMDIRGGGPASRESSLLDPFTASDEIHAVLLSGGSAFGLDAAGGVQKYLEERGIGFETGAGKVPLVCQSCLFDLSVGDPRVRPDQAMAYEACKNAQKANYTDGNQGAGTGATVGKLYGMEYCMKSGIGSCAVQIGDLKIGAVAAVNALGDIFDWKTGKKAAGLLAEDRKTFRSTEQEMYRSYQIRKNKFVGNTTLGVILTNAEFHKSELSKIAGMAHNGYAGAIRPVHTTADGDSIYALSLGKVAADLDVVGTLAARVMSEAVLRAVCSAESAYGCPSAKELTEYHRTQE